MIRSILPVYTTVPLSTTPHLVVEWPERTLGRLPPEHLLVTLAHNSNSSRTIEQRGAGLRAGAIVHQLRATSGLT